MHTVISGRAPGPPFQYTKRVSASGFEREVRNLLIMHGQLPVDLAKYFQFCEVYHQTARRAEILKSANAADFVLTAAEFAPIGEQGAMVPGGAGQSWLPPIDIAPRGPVLIEAKMSEPKLSSKSSTPRTWVSCNFDSLLNETAASAHDTLRTSVPQQAERNLLRIFSGIPARTLAHTDVGDELADVRWGLPTEKPSPFKSASRMLNPSFSQRREAFQESR
jgi:hypothetical protein